MYSALLQLFLQASEINKGLNQRLQHYISINRMPFTLYLKAVAIWLLRSPAVTLVLMEHMFLLPVSFGWSVQQIQLVSQQLGLYPWYPSRAACPGIRGSLDGDLWALCSLLWCEPPSECLSVPTQELQEEAAEMIFAWIHCSVPQFLCPSCIFPFSDLSFLQPVLAKG